MRPIIRQLQRWIILSLPFFFTACGPVVYDYRPIIEPANFSDLRGWQEDDLRIPYRMFAASCKAALARNPAYATRQQVPVGHYAGWQRTCQLANTSSEVTIEEARDFFEREFTPYRITTSYNEKGRFTGYYEPLVFGSYEKTAQFSVPVYALPPQGVRGYSRAEIEAGALRGKAPVLLYVNDPVMLFFLHIQGSGKVKLPDGTLIGLQYAGQNGHSYVPIGRILKARGDLEEVSLQTIRQWLYHHPDQAVALMQENPSYIYFKLAPGDTYPKGALGVPLTAGRSLAIDDDQAVYGLPIYIDTETVGVGGPQGAPLRFRRLMIAEDTGGAILGAHRGDIFFGRGAVAEYQAGYQNALGEVYWLLPRP